MFINCILEKYLPAEEQVRDEPPSKKPRHEMVVNANKKKKEIVLVAKDIKRAIARNIIHRVDKEVKKRKTKAARIANKLVQLENGDEEISSESDLEV